MKPSGVLHRLAELRAAAHHLRTVSSSRKNRVLKRVAQGLLDQTPRILRANRKDVAQSTDANAAFRDRLLLTEDRISQIARGVQEVARLPDPVGEVVEKKSLPNGLRVRKVRSPLGVIFMIFESRPNVAIEAFSLAFKAGNVILLKGGRESIHTTEVFYDLIREACLAEGLPEQCVWGISDPNRTYTPFLLTQKKWIDVVVPRGGDGLIEFVTQHSRIPIIKNDRGVCHVYVHRDADLAMARSIVVNAKTQRPGVCNAMETLLVHAKVAPELLRCLYGDPAFSQVTWKVCAKSALILEGRRIAKATSKSWDTEYLDLVLNCKVVASIDEAIAHIDRHGSHHSESIVTASKAASAKFESEIDAAVTYWNASTRFTDGFELGLGGELGISTQKLHVRGPVGLRELTSVRWIIEGNGQIR